MMIYKVRRSDRPHKNRHSRRYSSFEFSLSSLRRPYFLCCSSNASLGSHRDDPKQSKGRSYGESPWEEQGPHK